MANTQPDNLHTKKKSPLLPAPYFLLLLLIIAFALFFSLPAVQQHRAFLTNGLDIGNVDQALWNTAHGRFMEFTLMAPVTSRLALHVEPILLFFVPFYRAGLGGPELLLIAQAVVVAVGAWPLYQLASSKYQVAGSKYQVAKKTSSPPTSTTDAVSRNPQPVTRFTLLIFPLAYLLLPTLQSATLFDFHAVTLAPTFLLFAFLAIEQRKNRTLFVFLILAMACKEDMPLVVAMLGVYIGLARRRWRLAGGVIGLSIFWFVAALFVVQPLFAAGGNIQLERYAWLGDSPLEMIKTAITRPGLLFDHLWNQAGLPAYLAALFFPTAFLALFSPLTLLPMLPTLAENLLSDNPFTWRLEDFHYGAPLAPFLFISAIYGIRRMSEWANERTAPEDGRRGAGGPGRSLDVSPDTPHAPRITHHAIRNTQYATTTLLILLLTFTAVYHYYRGFSPLARPYIWPQVTAHHHRLNVVLDTIPADTPLFAQSNLAPHVSRREVIYADFAYFTDPDFPAATAVNDIVLDVTAFENIGGLHQFLQQTLLESGDYQLVTAQDGILHFQPAADNLSAATSLPASFFTFTTTDSPLDYPLPVDFGDVLRLHGFSLHFNRQEEVQVTVDLEPLQPLTDVQPVLYLLDAEGQPLGATTDLQPTLAWYPVEMWAPGQTVRLRFNTLPWYTRKTPSYRLALGLISGSDVWNVAGRLQPAVTPNTPFAVRTPAAGTLIELAQIKQMWQMPAGGPRLRQFERPAVPNSIEANFDHQLELFGYGAPAIKQGGAGKELLSMKLHWQAVSTPESLVRFVQLVGPDGLVYGQQDSAPDQGQYPTDRWLPGEVVADDVSFAVQSPRPAGQYTLHIGLYRPSTGERLPVLSGGDHVEIELKN